MVSRRSEGDHAECSKPSAMLTPLRGESIAPGGLILGWMEDIYQFSRFSQIFYCPAWYSGRAVCVVGGVS